MHVTSDRCHIPRGVKYLRIAEHFSIFRVPEIFQRIRPSLLILSQQMDVIIKKEYFFGSVVPPGISRQHILFLPCVSPFAESRKTLVGIIFKMICLYEYGVGEHIHVPIEKESLYLRIISTHVPFYDLATLVPERPPISEYGDAILSVVIQIIRPQSILLLILKLNESATKLRKVILNIVV